MSLSFDEVDAAIEAKELLPFSVYIAENNILGKKCDEVMAIALKKDFDAKIGTISTNDFDLSVDDIPYDFLLYNNLQELLLAMLYGSEWDSYLDKEERKYFCQVIESIYFYNIKVGCAHNPSVRMNLYKCFDHTFKYSQEIISARGMGWKVYEVNLKAAASHFLFDERVFERIKRGEDVGKRDIDKISVETYYNAVAFAEKNSVELPVHNVFIGFQTAREMACWLIQNAASQNLLIHKCEVCNNFYFPKRSDAKYCGTNCRTLKQEERRDPHIRSIEMKNNTFFFQKKSSISSYSFVDVANVGDEIIPILPERVQKMIIANSDSGKTNKNALLEIVFTSADFAEMQVRYLARKEQRSKEYTAIVNSCLRKDGSSRDAEDAKEDYLRWLKSINMQLKALKRISW